MLTLTIKHTCTQFSIITQHGQRIGQIHHHFRREAVAFVGPIYTDKKNMTVLLDQDVGHFAHV